MHSVYILVDSDDNRPRTDPTGVNSNNEKSYETSSKVCFKTVLYLFNPLIANAPCCALLYHFTLSNAR